jgi:UDP-xylose/UDP-N-acetylglucosamine transporter B4
MGVPFFQRIDAMYLTIYVDFCISGVSKLSSTTTSVTLNLVLTIRKFISVIISVVFFNNPFYLGNWIGFLIVIVGTIIYILPEKKSMDKIKTD